jgi:hypothetical protein
MQYNPVLDPNRFEFVMIDSPNNESRSSLQINRKPQDFGQVQWLYWKNGFEPKYFKAEQILLNALQSTTTK